MGVAITLADIAKRGLLGGGSGSSGGGSGGGGEGEKSPLDAMIDGSITEVSSDAERLRAHALYECANLTTANFPVATKIGNDAFRECSNLESVDCPEAVIIGNNAFYNCDKLSQVNFPKATEVGENAFFSSGLIEARFQQLTSVKTSAFNYCVDLEKADIGNAETLYANAFVYCYKLTSFIMRSQTLCTLKKTNVFTGCSHMLGTTDSTYNPDGLHDGYAYVPRSLVEEYPAATNWSALTLQYRALEDYTVDGTITGELDESKI